MYHMMERFVFDRFQHVYLLYYTLNFKYGRPLEAASTCLLAGIMAYTLKAVCAF